MQRRATLRRCQFRRAWTSAILRLSLGPVLMKEVLMWTVGKLQQHKLPYFLSTGTALGVFRHNGTIIPWDTDVDIAMDPKYEKDLTAWTRWRRRWSGNSARTIGSHSQPSGHTQRFTPGHSAKRFTRSRRTACQAWTEFYLFPKDVREDQQLLSQDS